MRKKPKSTPKPKGYLVWGIKHPGKGKQANWDKGRQLGVGHQLKKNANKEASNWRKKGYIAHVQPTLRTPKRR